MCKRDFPSSCESSKDRLPRNVEDLLTRNVKEPASAKTRAKLFSSCPGCAISGFSSLE
jgi:hypothetical protein